MVLRSCAITEIPVACFSCRLWPEQVAYSTGAGTTVFEPFKEIEEAELRVLHQDDKSDRSLARLQFADTSESAMNDQINVLYNLSYIYHSLFAYFDCDDVALLGFARYFKEESDHRRQRAEELKEYQNVRGGRVHLSPLLPDEILDFDQVRKTMKLVTGLEKLSTEKFYGLHKVAQEAQDKHLSHLIKSRYLAEQIGIVKRLAEYVAQLSLIGDEDGHGIYYFDREFGTEEI
ncbi:hypothetical protein R1sor_002261 [Riccia sorocarpa]|uniref:Ferritin n=1 Tax=Riccia sorocarpa TaxID=122646 RepID=A0ABD3H0Z8_9MARC